MYGLQTFERLYSFFR